MGDPHVQLEDPAVDERFTDGSSSIDNFVAIPTASEPSQAQTKQFRTTSTNRFLSFNYSPFYHSSFSQFVSQPWWNVQKCRSFHLHFSFSCILPFTPF